MHLASGIVVGIEQISVLRVDRRVIRQSFFDDEGLKNQLVCADAISWDSPREQSGRRNPQAEGFIGFRSALERDNGRVKSSNLCLADSAMF